MASATLYVSKSGYYVGYNADGEYREEGNIQLITINGPTTSGAYYKYGNISGDNANLQYVSNNGYNSNPTVTFALKGNLNKNSISFTIKWVAKAGPYSDSSVSWTLNLSNSEHTVNYTYLTPSGNTVGTESMVVCQNANAIVKYVNRGIFEQNNLYYAVYSWYFNNGGTNYNASVLSYVVFPNQSINLRPNEYYSENESLHIHDYPTVGNTSYYLYAQKCVAGSNASSFTIPANPSQDHYTFNGFFNNDNTIQYTSGQTLEASQSYSIYARWTADVYTTTFSTSGTAVEHSTVTTTYPESITLPSTSKAYHVFDGWYDSASGGNRVGGIGDTYIPSSTATLYAHFTPIDYTITYVTTGTAVDPSTVQANNPTGTTLPSTSKTYYEFDGWYNSASGGTRAGGSGDTYHPTGDIILYAQFTKIEYTITYVTDGTSVTTPVLADAIDGTTLPNTVKNHYGFAGWYTSSTGGTRKGGAGDNFKPTSDITLYAQFTFNQYTITYVSGWSVTTETVTYPQTTVLPSRSKNYYTFNGWYTLASGGTKIGNAGDTYQPTSDVTMYAQFTPIDYTITFVTSGSSVTTPVTANYSTGINLPSTSKDYNTFNGWYTASTGGTKKGDAGTLFKPTGNITLYAQFTEIQYTITYVTDGSTVTSPVTGVNSTGVTLPNTTKTHYTFNGWYTASSGGTKVGNNGDTYHPTVNITLYARFTGILYTVTYSTTGSAVSPTSVSVRYPNKTVLPSTTKEHYNTSGWYTASSGGTKVGNVGAEYQPTSNITLHAQFTGITYTVTFKDAGGTGSVADVVRSAQYPNTVNVPSNPHSTTAFTFQGWSLESDRVAVISSTATTYQPTSDITVIRRYAYSRTLRNNDASGTVLKNAQNQNAVLTADYPDAINLPTESNRQSITVPDVSGYRIKGWAWSKQASSPSTNPTANYTTAYTPTLNDTSANLYVARIPAPLTSITIPSLTELTKGGDSVQVTPVLNPPDWLGSLTWEITAGAEAYFNINYTDAKNKSAYLTGLSATGSNSPGLTVKARSLTYDNSSAYITSAFMQVGVSEYIPVYFWTRDALDRETEYLVQNHYNSQNELTNVWFVERDIHDNYTWVSNYDHATPPRTFPPNPSRTGYTFTGWLSGEGHDITQSDPPHYPVDCYATWIDRYEASDKDVGVFQQFNKDGSVIQLKMDLATIQSLDEMFTFSLNTVPTPTMTSDKTFITDMYCTEMISIGIIRKQPVLINDQSDDSHYWSNGKWIQNLRGLVDRWQAETDGIKFLYLPRGMRSMTLNGETICYGDNYDMLGYVKPRSYVENSVTKYNVGLLYGNNDEYVLQGYNCLITSYSDSYKGGEPMTLTVSMSLTLGGMVSMYQDWAKGMLLQ